MSRIEDALNKARYKRSIFEKKEIAAGSAGADFHDSGINVLVISHDQSISCLVRNLQSLAQADVLVSNNIANGMRTLLEQRNVAINDFELRFTALMLDTLSCCYGWEAENTSTG